MAGQQSCSIRFVPIRHRRVREAGRAVVWLVRISRWSAGVIIRSIAAYGGTGEAECGLTGVWVGQEKVAAIGVRISRPAGAAGGWVTTHGFALNVDVDLGWFARIVPCGIAGHGVPAAAFELLAK